MRILLKSTAPKQPFRLLRPPWMLCSLFRGVSADDSIVLTWLVFKQPTQPCRVGGLFWASEPSYKTFNRALFPGAKWRGQEKNPVLFRLRGQNERGSMDGRVEKETPERETERERAKSWKGATTLGGRGDIVFGKENLRHCDYDIFRSTSSRRKGSLVHPSHLLQHVLISYRQSRRWRLLNIR